MRLHTLAMLAVLALSACAASPPSPSFTHEIRSVATWNALARARNPR